MNGRDNLRFVLLFVDLLFIALCVLGVKQSSEKAWIGVALDADDDRRPAVVGEVLRPDSPLRANDEIRRIDRWTIRTHKDVEQILDQFPVGETCRLEIIRDASAITVPVQLVPYYSLPDLVIQSLGIAIFFMLALFVLWRQPDDTPSLQFHHLAVLVACVLAFTAGRFTMEPHGVGYALRALLPFSNAFIGSAILHFALVFPRSRQLPLPAMLLLHLPPLAVSVWGAVASVRATLPFDLDAAPASYAAVMTAKAMLGAGAVAAVGVFFRNFLRCDDSAHRRQIAWAMTGATLSTVAFILWQLSTSAAVRRFLPDSLITGVRGLNMEEAILNAALVLTAAFMAIGIVRYRIFNIEVILKRGTVYTVVLLILIVVNAGILSLGIRLVGGLSDDSYFLIMSALAIDLLLFIPIRDFVQRGVNRLFFRIEYDYREALRDISDRMQKSVVAESTAEVLVTSLDRLLQVEGVAVLIVREGGHLVSLRRNGFPHWKSGSLHLRRERLRQLPDRPMVFGSAIEPGASVVRSELPFARRYRISLLFPLRTEEGSVIGLLALGQRKSGSRFTLEDIDLVRALAVQAGMHFERLQLQQRLLVEHHEAEKLRELNRMKSFFVSGVSHDLKTPLTSISMFAELLAGQLADQGPDTHRSLEIIQGECGRLGRLIDNVLDFTRIERGALEYRLVPEDLNQLARRAHDTMAYQLRIGGFVCGLELAAGPLPVKADAEAVLQAVTNLLGNAMKYSGESRSLVLRTERDNGRAVMAVQDFGLGIRPEDVPQLFEPFFRSRSDQVQKLGGVGLGLSLVRHIADAHGARVDVESAPGEGSTFRMSFELQEEQ